MEKCVSRAVSAEIAVRRGQYQPYLQLMICEHVCLSSSGGGGVGVELQFSRSLGGQVAAVRKTERLACGGSV